MLCYGFRQRVTFASERCLLCHIFLAATLSPCNCLMQKWCGVKIHNIAFAWTAMSIVCCRYNTDHSNVQLAHLKKVSFVGARPETVFARSDGIRTVVSIYLNVLPLDTILMPTIWTDKRLTSIKRNILIQETSQQAQNFPPITRIFTTCFCHCKMSEKLIDGSADGMFFSPTRVT